MSTDIVLTDNSIVLDGAEVQNTGPMAGYAFRDRSQPNQQRWVLYANGGPARLYADSRGGDVVTVDPGGEIRTTGPTAGYTLADRTKPAEATHTWQSTDTHLVLNSVYPKEKASRAHVVVEKDLINLFNSVLVTGLLRVGHGLSVTEDTFIQGDLTVTGKVKQASSVALKDDVAELSGPAARAALDELNPVTFHYKTDPKRERNVGFLAEEAPDLVAGTTRDSLSAMDIVAVLTKVVKEQQRTIDELAARIDGSGR
jgi:hypothetical protein